MGWGHRGACPLRAILSSVMAVGLLGLLTFAVAPASAQTGNGVRLPVSYGILQPPPSKSTYVDPVFGTTIKRISDALHTVNADSGGMLPWIENEYSTAAPFNSDNSRLILVHNSYFGLYDGAGSFLGNLPMETNSSSEPRWSRTDNNTLYYHATNQLKTYNVATKTTKVVHSFTEYGSISGNGEMDISLDGDHLVFAGDQRYVFVYTISTDSKSAAFDTDGHAFDSVYITPDNHVSITWKVEGINTHFTGIELFDSNMNFLRQIAHVGSHMHMTRDLNGDEVLIWFNAADHHPACGTNAVVKIHLADGVQTCLLSLDWSLAVHITAADSTWAFVETYNPIDVVPPTGWAAYTDELLQIKLDGSEVRRLAHHRSRPTNNYNYEPKLSVSRDGTRLVYASNFGMQLIAGALPEYGDEYMMTIPGSAAVVNGASFQAALAPGSMISIFGTGLASGTESAPGMPLATLQNVVVSFHGIPAPLYYVSPTQINAQIPYGLAPGSATMLVMASGSPTVTQAVTIAAAAPGIFTADSSGTGPGAILRGDDYQVVSQSAPTQTGAFISIYCTGLGELANASTAILPQVSVGNIAAQVTFSGLAPGFAGLYQVNVQIPAGVAPGSAVPVILTSAGVSSNTATIVVQ